MKRTLALCFVLVCLLLTGCTGTTVIYQEIQRPDTSQPTPAPEVSVKGAVKTGLAMITDISGSQSAVEAAFDVTVVAVTVDDDGVIRGCIIDGVSAKMPFDTTGTITGDITAPVLTKNELGDDYGMKQYGGAKYEWYQQVAALADYAVGKTAAQLRSDALDSTGYAADENLAATATIYLGGLVSAIEEAATGARHAGAVVGDELRLAVIPNLSGSTSATGETAGRVRLDCDVAVLTRDGEIITSCRIDSVQADVSFDAMGTITNELSRDVKTKTELGDDYGMKRYGGAKYEWYEQAASFADYAAGKAAVEILSLSVSDGKTTQPDLATSVTISVTPFQALIAKACGLS